MSAFGSKLGKKAVLTELKNPIDARNVSMFCFYCIEVLDLHKLGIKQVSATSLPGSQIGTYPLIYLSDSQLRQLCLKFLEVTGFHGRMSL